LLVLLLVLDLQTHYYLVCTRDAVFWRDEAQHLQLALERPSKLLSHLMSEWEPYAYIVALRWWCNLFGVSEASARSLSWVSVMAATVLMYRGARRWFGRRETALAAAVVLGSSPMVLERILNVVKPYGFALFASALAFERLTCLESRRTWGVWLGFAGASFLMLNTQPVNFAWAAALGTIWFIRRSSVRGGLRGLVRAAQVPVVFAACAIPTLVQGLRFAGAETGCSRLSPADLTMGFMAKFGLKIFAALSPIGYYGLYHSLDDYIGESFGALLSLPPELLVILLLVMAGLVAAALRLAWRRCGRAVADTLLLVVITTGLLALAGLVNARMVWVWKCFSAAGIAFSLALAMLPAGSRGLTWALIGMTLLRAAIGLPAYGAVHSGKSSDARDAAVFIASRARPSDLIVLANTALSPAFSYYYHGPGRQIHHPYDHAIKYYDMMSMYTYQGEEWRAQRTAAIMRRAAREGRRVWFVEGGTPPPLPKHRWYSTADLPLFEKTLAEYFIPGAERDFAATEEPFHVFLYIPAGGDQGEGGHAQE